MKTTKSSTLEKYFFSKILFVSIAVLTLTACTNETPVTVAPETDYTELGKTIAQETFKTLSGNLKTALQEGGIPNAINYCTINAYPIVDSLSEVHHAEIRRTSFRYRNSENAPTKAESTQLEIYQTTFTTGEKLLPATSENKGVTTFYAPILTKPMCLNCHGVIGQNIDSTNYALIQSLYPEDKATGYAAGELRGMWSIAFRK